MHPVLVRSELSAPLIVGWVVGRSVLLACVCVALGCGTKDEELQQLRERVGDLETELDQTRAAAKESEIARVRMQEQMARGECAPVTGLSAALVDAVEEAGEARAKEAAEVAETLAENPPPLMPTLIPGPSKGGSTTLRIGPGSSLTIAPGASLRISGEGIEMQSGHQLLPPGSPPPEVETTP